MIKNLMAPDSKSAIDSILDIIKNGPEYEKRIAEIKVEQKKLADLIEGAGGLTRIKNLEHDLKLKLEEADKEKDGVKVKQAEAEVHVTSAKTQASTILSDALSHIRGQKDDLDRKGKDLTAFNGTLKERELSVMSQEATLSERQRRFDGEMDRLDQLKDQAELARKDYVARKETIDKALSGL